MRNFDGLWKDKRLKECQFPQNDESYNLVVSHREKTNLVTAF